MKNTLLLLAGYPGTGKTYLCNKILERNSCFLILSPDTIKESFWDLYGYDTLEEKEILNKKSLEEYYNQMEKALQKGQNIISDYPFSAKQKQTLKSLTAKYDCQVITIRLIADIDVLFERQKKRDMDETRHIGHILNCYHKGQTLDSRKQAEGLLSYEEFCNRCKNRGYDTFELGHTIEIDVTDFKAINYTALLDDVFSNLQ